MKDQPWQCAACSLPIEPSPQGSFVRIGDMHVDCAKAIFGDDLKSRGELVAKLVEAAYREGHGDGRGYDGAVDWAWDHSLTRKALETPIAK